MFFNPMGLPRALIELLMDRTPRYTVLPKAKRENGGKGKGGVPSLLVLHRSIGRDLPERPRHWHNPADPIQAARIEAARKKRAMRAKKADRDAARSYERNRTHFSHSSSYALDPFHVVRS